MWNVYFHITHLIAQKYYTSSLQICFTFEFFSRKITNIFTLSVEEQI